MLNKIILMGRLTRDPEMRTVGDAQTCNFSLACDRDYKNKDGGRDTDFIDVVAWRKTAETVCKYFHKGRLAIVDGRLQIRVWTDREGNNRRSMEVVASNVYFADSKSKTDGNGEPAVKTDGDFQLPDGFDVGDLVADGEAPF